MCPIVSCVIPLHLVQFLKATGKYVYREESTSALFSKMTGYSNKK